MSSRLSRIGSNATLNTYIQGAARQAIAPIQEFLAPTVPVATMNGKYKQWDEKSALVIPSTRRTNGGAATVIGFDAKDASYDLNPNALDFPVDKNEQEDETLINLLQEGADITAQLAALSSFKETVDLALATLGAGTDVNIATANIDLVNSLDGFIRSVILGAKGMSSMMELRILWGFDAWRKFKNHASVKGRFVNGKKESTEITLTNVESLFVKPAKQMMNEVVYDANKNKDAADIQFVLDSSLIIFLTCAQPTRYDTSFMKTFRKRGAFMTPRFYEREDKRVDFAGFDWNEQIAAPTPGAAIRINWTEA